MDKDYSIHPDNKHYYSQPGWFRGESICVEDELESLGINATIVTDIILIRYDVRTSFIIFESDEDLNLYKVAGTVKDGNGVKLTTTSRIHEEFK